MSVKIEVVSRCFTETQNLTPKTCNREKKKEKTLSRSGQIWGEAPADDRLGKIGGGWTKDRVTETCMPLIPHI